MLTLEWRWGWSIYSLGHEGVSEGEIQGQRPRLRTGSAGRPQDVGRPEAREGPDVRSVSDVRGSIVRRSLDFRHFGTGDLAPDFRMGSDVRAKEAVGRSEGVGLPVAVEFFWSSGWDGLQASDVWKSLDVRRLSDVRLL